MSISYPRLDQFNKSEEVHIDERKFRSHLDMSFTGSRQCKCSRYSFSLASPKREWVVVQRHQNRSAYNGYILREGGGYDCLVKESNWSHVLCISCGSHWRTQAGYVDALPDLSEEGQQLCYRHLKEGKPAGQLLLAKIADSYNRPLFSGPAESSSSRSTRARNLPSKAAIGGRSRR